MLSKVARYIGKHKLLNLSELYIVALSGGADSVALLLLLDEMGYKVHAAHCNFHLRGAESDRDEAFCEQLCRDKNIPFHRAHFDTREYAELHKVSTEMAARELRYHWFEQLREDIGATGICVAHHRDDSVETVILNMARGTGVRGLTGIRPRNGYILRPLLCVSRAEIEDFLAQRGQKYVTDSTNLEDEATRNKVRHHIIPELQQLNSKALENIQRMTERMAAVEALLDDYKQKSVRVEADRTVIRKTDVLSDYLLYELLADYGFNSVQAVQICASMCADSIGSIFSSADYDLLVDRECLLIEPHLEPMKPLVIPETGVYVLDEEHKIRVESGDFPVSKDPYVATLDASKVNFPLTVRRVEEGDWMVPYGMKGRKLLSDLMTDMKLSIFDKRKQLVIIDNQGIIIWAIGLRVSQNVAIPSAESTPSILRVFFS
ncbi:MAG: tRNA lysidine(34) synthetase TilS [Prevotella sp.]|nr:tRNA lysidine(34) synthetase TilS [Prevotella sp.]